MKSHIWTWKGCTFIVSPKERTRENGSWLVADGWYKTVGGLMAEGGVHGAKVARSMNLVGVAAEATKQLCKGLVG